MEPKIEAIMQHWQDDEDEIVKSVFVIRKGAYWVSAGGGGRHLTDDRSKAIVFKSADAATNWAQLVCDVDDDDFEVE